MLCISLSIGFITSNFEKSALPFLIVITLQFLSVAGFICLLSLMTRRIREIGYLIIAYIGILLFSLAAPNLDFLKIIALIAQIVLIFLPSWDQEKSFMNITALIRRVVLSDGGIDSRIENSFIALYQDVFNLPKEVVDKAVRQFKDGHQDYESIIHHTKTIKDKLGSDKAVLADIMNFIKGVSVASGSISKKKYSLIKEIANHLGVEGLLSEHIKNNGCREVATLLFMRPPMPLRITSIAIITG